VSSLIEGRCACGAINYQIDAKIEFAFKCHCRKCQRATGGGHSSAFAVPVNKFKSIGRIKEFRLSSDNGAATYSGFCSECGSPMTSRTERFPERIYIHAATLNDPSVFHPEFVVFSEMAQPWDTPCEQLVKAPR